MWVNFKTNTEYRQVEFHRVPLTKQFVRQRWQIWSEIERKPYIFGKNDFI